MRYVLFALLTTAAKLASMILAPALVLFARPAYGPVNNAGGWATEPRLPRLLSWFMTPDNSLWGDTGWRTKHCPDHWDDWWGMVRWLWRNPALGFCWTVCGHQITAATTFSVRHGASGMEVDKGGDRYGWFLIRASDGAFQLRFAWAVLGVEISGDFGWLLDVYANNPLAYQFQPLAPCQCTLKVAKP